MTCSTLLVRTQAKASTIEAEKDALTEQWKTAHDVCSVSALNFAFEDCKENDTTYDLGIIFYLHKYVHRC
jgi:hypothetical protein